MKNFISISLIHLLCSSIFAQEPTVFWTKTFGDSGYDAGHSVQQTSDGGYIITGAGFGGGAVLIKTDADGNAVWTNIFEGNPGDHGGSAVQQLPGGGYLVTGQISRSAVLIKTDENGEVVWKKDYGYGQGNSIQLSNDGHYIIAGDSLKFVVAGFPCHDNLLLKTDVNGNTLWRKTFGASGDRTNNEGRSVKQARDDGYIITGMSAGDIFLTKTDIHGDIQWTKTFGGSSDDWGASIELTSDGGYIITGATQSFGPGHTNAWLIKTDAQGDTLWSKIIGGDQSDEGSSVHETMDGGFIITGYTVSFGSGNGDVWLVKTDPNGQTQWTGTFGGSHSDAGYSVQQTSHGGFIIVGMTSSFGAGDFDIWIIKTSQDVTAVDQKSNPLIKGFQLKQNYPNPFNPKTVISYLLSGNSNISLKIYDIMGRELKTIVNEKQPAGEYSVSLDASGLASGIYIYRLRAGNFEQSRKMLLLR